MGNTVISEDKVTVKLAKSAPKIHIYLQPVKLAFIIGPVRETEVSQHETTRDLWWSPNPMITVLLRRNELSLVAHSFNPVSLEAEAGRLGLRA